MRLVLFLLLSLVCWGSAEPPKKSPSALERRVVTLTNVYRARNGSRPVLPNSELRSIGTEHSSDMARRGFFSHVSPVKGKRTPQDRARQAGWNRGVAENLSLVPLSSSDPALDAVEGWKKSEGHAATMLSKGHQLIGVGVVIGKKGYYFTQLFSSSPTTGARKKGETEVGMVFNSKDRKTLKPAEINTNLPYTSQDKKLAALLLRARTRNTFPQEQAHDYRNVRAFLYLAEHHSEPMVRVQALRALGFLYSYDPSRSASFVKAGVGTLYHPLLKTDKNLKRVVDKAMKSSDTGVRNTAYGVVGSSYDKENVEEGLAEQLARRVRSETGNNRENALGSLCAIREPSETRDQVALEFLRGSDPHLIYKVLSRYSKRTQASQKYQQALFQQGLGLVNHPHQGVRAGALQFSGFLAKGSEQRTRFEKKLDRALLDPVPGMRSRAAFLARYHLVFGSMEHLVSISNDMRSTKDFELTGGFRATDVGLQRVGDQALRSLDELSRKLPGVENFEYRLQNASSGVPTQEELRIMQEEAARAKAWLQSVRGDLPRQY